MSLMYENPFFYNMFVKILHGRSLRKRYKLIAREIGENKRVFEPGCGTCLVYPYLQTSCEYEGWDLNEKFLGFCIRNGIKVSKKDVFDFQNYPDNDVILICDLLHHLIPRHEGFVLEALKRTKKLIVSEPARSFKPHKMLKPIILPLYRTLLDSDGINQPHQTIEWDYDEEKLRNFFQKLGCTKTIKVGWDMIAVFDKREQTILSD